MKVARVDTVSALRSAMAGISCKPLPYEAPLAVILASAHGSGDIEPIENLLTEVRHICESLTRITGDVLCGDHADDFLRGLCDHVHQAATMIERKADAAERLSSMAREESRPATVAPPASETRWRPTATPASEATPQRTRQAGARMPDARDDAKPGQCSRDLRRCLDEGSRDAFELYRQVGSTAAHHAGIGRLLSLVARILDEAGDAELGGEEMMKALHEAGTPLEFALAEWAVRRANAEDGTTRSAIP